MKHILLLTFVISLISCKTLQDVTSKQEISRHKNIKIIESAVYPVGVCEPTIAISPLNPKNIIAGNLMRDVYLMVEKLGLLKF